MNSNVFLIHRSVQPEPVLFGIKQLENALLAAELSAEHVQYWPEEHGEDLCTEQVKCF